MLDGVSSGQAVYVPAGTYIVTMLGYQSNLKLFGDGIGKSILKLKASQDSPILYRYDRLSSWVVGPNTGDKFSLSGSGFSQYADIHISGISFDGNSANQSSGVNNWFDWTVLAVQTNRFRIDRCEIKNGRLGGVIFYWSQYYSLERSWIHDNVVSGNGGNQVSAAYTALQVFDGTSVNNGLFHANLVTGSTGNAITTEFTWGDVLDGNWTIGTATSPLSIGGDSTQYCKIVNNHVQYGYLALGNSDNTIWIPSNNTVANNTLTNSLRTDAADTYGMIHVQVQGLANDIVTGNTIIGGKATGSGATGAAIVVKSNLYSSPASGITISNNIVEGQNDSSMVYGIFGQNADSVIVSANRIGTKLYGIHVDHGNRWTILANHLKPVTANLSHAIRLNDGCHSLNILGNTLQDFHLALYFVDSVFTKYDVGPHVIGGNRLVNCDYDFSGIGSGTIKWQFPGLAESFTTADGTFEANEIIWQTAFTSGNPFAKVCTVAGTQGTLTGNATTVAGSPYITLNSLTAGTPAVGSYILVANGGVTTPRKVIAASAFFRIVKNSLGQIKASITTQSYAAAPAAAITLTSGVDFTLGTDDTAGQLSVTAANLAAAINANGTLNTKVIATHLTGSDRCYVTNISGTTRNSVLTTNDWNRAAVTTANDSAAGNGGAILTIEANANGNATAAITFSTPTFKSLANIP